MWSIRPITSIYNENMAVSLDQNAYITSSIEREGYVEIL